MKPMENLEAAAVLDARANFLEHHFPSHPAVQSGQRAEIYALRLGIKALKETEVKTKTEEVSA